VHPGDLARGCSDLEMIWLVCCAGAATGSNAFIAAESLTGRRGKSKK